MGGGNIENINEEINLQNNDLCYLLPELTTYFFFSTY